MGVKQRDAICHVHSAICRAGGQQQPVDATARKEAAVQVHLHISPAGQLHFTHGDGREDKKGPNGPTRANQKDIKTRSRLV